MKYHGNYCGPYWSAGKYQRSVVDPDISAIDEFDHTCLIHDAAYANGDDTTKADLDFFKQNIFEGPKRSLAAVIVGTQGLYKSLLGAQINMTRNLRGPKSLAKANSSNTSLTTVPASYGFSLRMTPPVIKRSGNKATIIGSDFAGSVRTQNTANYQPAASVLLNPAYFQNAMLGSLSRAFEKFRFVKAVIQYIPSVPTSTQGQLVMCSSRSIKEPFFDGAGTTFLSRALSQGNAVATPLWKETTLEVACSEEWSIVDALIDSDLDDSIQEEVQCYTTCDSTTVAGILMLHYEVEFKDPLYTYHATMIPVPMGNGSFGTLVDNSAVNAATDPIRLTGSVGFAFTGGDSSIYRLIFRQEASTKPVGPPTWASVAAVENTAISSSTLVSLVNTPIALNTGTVLYGVLNGNDIVLYASIDAAKTGALNGAIMYQWPTTAIGTWAFIGSIVRLSDHNRVTSQ